MFYMSNIVYNRNILVSKKVRPFEMICDNVRVDEVEHSGKKNHDKKTNNL